MLGPNSPSTTPLRVAVPLPEQLGEDQRIPLSLGRGVG